MHRAGQLERYNAGVVSPAAAHPDAKKHRLYDAPETMESPEEDSDEDDEETAEIRWFLQKAQVSCLIKCVMLWCIDTCFSFR